MGDIHVITERMSGMKHEPLLIEKDKDLLKRLLLGDPAAVGALARTIRTQFGYVSQVMQSRATIDALLDAYGRKKQPKPPPKEMVGKIESYMGNIDSLFIAQSWLTVRKAIEDSREERIHRIMQTHSDPQARMKALDEALRNVIYESLVDWFKTERPHFGVDQEALFMDALYSNGIPPPPSIQERDKQLKRQAENIDEIRSGNAHKLLAFHILRGYGTAITIMGHLVTKALNAEIMEGLSTSERMSIVRKEAVVAAMLAYLPKPVIQAVDSQKLALESDLVVYQPNDRGILFEINYQTLEDFFKRFLRNNKELNMDNLEYAFKVFKQKTLHGCPALASALKPFYNVFCDEMRLVLEN